MMDPGEGRDQCSSGCRVTFEDKQHRDKPQGKKSRQNFEWHENNGHQPPGPRAKQRPPGNVTANGFCPRGAPRPDAADPYSVAYNVDSKTNIDKCLSSKIDCSDRKAEGFLKARCSWSLENILSQGSQYIQQVSCEDNDDDLQNVKINNTDNELVNGGSASGSALSVVNNLESRFPPTNCSQVKTSASTDNSVNTSNRNDFNINVPSTSGSNGGATPQKAAGGSDDVEVGCARASRKRPAKGREKRQQLAVEDSSSDTGNDDYSVGSDDCCIYTYRGGEHLADLPSSFFSLDMGLAVDHHLPAPPLFGPRQEPLHDDRAARDSGASSPDMDYLEMDFDPGPSCEADSNEESSLDLDLDDAAPSVHTPPPEESVPVSSLGVSEKRLESVDAKIDIALSPAVSSCNEILPNSDNTGEVKNSTEVSGSSDNVGLGFSMEPSTSKTSFPSTSGASVATISIAKNESASVIDEDASEVEEPAAKDKEDHRPYGMLIPHTTLSGELIYVRRTSLSWPAREIQGHHSTSGDLVSPGETCEGDLPDSLSWTCLGGMSPEQGGILEASRVNLSSALFHCTMAKRLVVDKQSANFLQEQDTSNVDGAGVGGSGEPPAVHKMMVWSEQEACSRQVTQIGTSACGATAVINALLPLQDAVDVERVTSAVRTRLRAHSAPLARYLLSRSVAGCGERALLAGLRAGSGGAVSARHFATWPERALPLSHWLAYWIGLGAVPIATLNLQAGVADPSRIPDSWHHQMIFGVSPRGIYLANPVECVEEGALWHQLCSDSILLVKRKDILSRWTRDTDLTPLTSVPGDVRWRTMNVLGQVVNIIRESHNSATNGQTRTTHLRIPVCYRAGITIAVLTGSEAHKRLLQAPELPLLHPDEE